MSIENKTNDNYLNNLKERHYIINLQKNRSLLALIASFCSLIIAIYAIISGLILYARLGESPIDLFQYFTTNANIITAFGSSLIIPYAIDGFRKKRFYCPKWAVLFYYGGTVYTTLIMIFAVCVISIVNPEMAFGGNNFYLHIICPIMILVSFLLIESYYSISVKDALRCIIPVFVYALIYIYKVIIVGAENGGWEDIYCFTIYAPAALSFAIMMAFTFLIALFVRALYNKLSKYRINKLCCNLWNENVSEVEIKIEIFGLCRYIGKRENKSYATLPLDIISIISDKYHIKKEDLIAVYTKGLVDSVF